MDFQKKGWDGSFGNPYLRGISLMLLFFKVLRNDWLPKILVTDIFFVF